MSISITNSLTLRIYYNNYADYVKKSNRNDASIGTLSMADASALRNAIKKLQDYDFESGSTKQNQEKLQAFTDTLNNALTSASEYGINSTTVKNAASTIRKLNTEYASELKKIGITTNKDGTVSLYDSAADTYSSERFTKFFDKESKYLTEVYNAAKKITRRVDVRI